MERLLDFLLLFFFIALINEIVIKFAEEPELTNVEYFTPSHLDHFSSNSFTLLDCVRIGFDRLRIFLSSEKSDFEKLLCIKE